MVTVSRWNDKHVVVIDACPCKAPVTWRISDGGRGVGAPKNSELKKRSHSVNLIMTAARINPFLTGVELDIRKGEPSSTGAAVASRVYANDMHEIN